MKKSIIITAVSLIAVGLILFTCAFAAAGFDFTKLSTEKYVTNTYTVSASFTRINIHTGTSDIIFKLSPDGKCRVDSLEREKAQNQVTVENGALTIRCNDRRSWYDYLTFSTKSLSMTVYLPEKTYDSLTIDASTGDVTIPADFTFGSLDVDLSTGDINCAAEVTGSAKINTSTGDVTYSAAVNGSLKIETTTGNIRLDGVTAESIDLSATTGNIALNGAETVMGITVETSTGNVMLKNTVACGALAVDTSTGNVRFEDSDAGSIKVDTSTGDVTGTLRTPKIFYTDTSTGSVSLPDVRMGEKCEITTSTGDIDIAIVER